MNQEAPVMRIRSDFGDELCAGDLLLAAHEEVAGRKKPYEQPQFLGFYLSDKKQYITDGVLNAEIKPCGLIEDLANRLKRLKIRFNLEVHLGVLGHDSGHMLIYDSANGDCYLFTVREAIAQLQNLNNRRPAW